MHTQKRSGHENTNNGDLLILMTHISAVWVLMLFLASGFDVLFPAHMLIQLTGVPAAAIVTGLYMMSLAVVLLAKLR